jgi:amidase
LDQSIAGLRIGIDSVYSTANLQRDIVDSLQAFAAVLRERGARVVEVTMPAVDDDLLNRWAVLCGGDSAVAHANTYPSRAASYGTTFRTFLEYANTLSAADYARAHIARLRFTGGLRAMFREIDAFLCPSMPFLPPPVSLLNPYMPFYPAIGSIMRFTAPFDYSGNPTLSVPCGFSPEGLPYSAQLVADHLNEALLCRLGHTYQQATTWHTRRPPLASA